MTKFDAEWVAAEEARRAFMAEHGMYSLEEEHSSCGVGLVVAVDGKPSRRVVENGINALKAVWHRGAVDADGKTGDGAGIHVQQVNGGQIGDVLGLIYARRSLARKPDTTEYAPCHQVPARLVIAVNYTKPKI